MYEGLTLSVFAKHSTKECKGTKNMHVCMQSIVPVSLEAACLKTAEISSISVAERSAIIHVSRIGCVSQSAHATF